MKINTLGFVGGGRVTRFLLEALQNNNALPEKVLVSDPNADTLKTIAAVNTDIIQTTADNRVPASADVVFLSVHPPVMPHVLQEIRNVVRKDAVVVSLAPVVKLTVLSEGIGGFNRIARMIPNAPSVMGKGYNPVAFAEGFATVDKDELKQWFSVWGETPEVDEPKLEAYAIVSAMGPTYYWFQWIELERLALSFGFSADEIRKTLPAMLHGAVDALYHSGLAPERVLDLVPVRPLQAHEEAVRSMMDGALSGLYQKLTNARDKKS
jgi:pyrroline-5-carboxylate reductase